MSAQSPTRLAARRDFGAALPGPAPSTGGSLLTSQTCNVAAPLSVLVVGMNSSGRCVGARTGLNRQKTAQGLLQASGGDTGPRMRVV